ncbi:MAG: hypothetical protein AMJ90_04015 [candidate division Zixibacteria bacterium SM23_73_2]|nr:MAG: hypothetical protein AMJ90_04015 [candidate division Zixibacteria bacterium SM23_73_2]
MRYRIHYILAVASSLICSAVLLQPLSNVLGDTGRKPESTAKKVQPKTKLIKIENGLRIIDLCFPKGLLSDDNGSITLVQLGTGYGASMERPGDATVGAWIPGSTSYQTLLNGGVGSEIRFNGDIELDSLLIQASFPERLCVRRVASGWAYVCGRGRLSFKDSGTSITVGEERTTDECMRLLASENAVLREGAARDLGRLVRPQDRTRAVPALRTLLDDSSSYVRCGAAEGLALVGGAEAFAALKAACAATSERTSERDCFDYWVAVSGGLTLLGDPQAGDIELAEAARAFLGDSAAGTQKWAMYSFAGSAVFDLISDGRTWSPDTLASRLGSMSPDVRLAAVRLLAHVHVDTLRERLQRIAESDEDARIRQAANATLKSMDAK